MAKQTEKRKDAEMPILTWGARFVTKLTIAAVTIPQTWRIMGNVPNVTIVEQVGAVVVVDLVFLYAWLRAESSSKRSREVATKDAIFLAVMLAVVLSVGFVGGHPALWLIRIPAIALALSDVTDVLGEFAANARTNALTNARTQTNRWRSQRFEHHWRRAFEAVFVGQQRYGALQRLWHFFVGQRDASGKARDAMERSVVEWLKTEKGITIVTNVPPAPKRNEEPPEHSGPAPQPITTPPAPRIRERKPLGTALAERFCANPACGKRLAADTPKRRKYCNDTCKQQAFRIRHGLETLPETFEAAPKTLHIIKDGQVVGSKPLPPM